uniref:SET domain-containing protein n=1 Tax=Macrostomum lignano TaxID=282301 RepID=A0A1I8JSC3_9PLAT
MDIQELEVLDSAINEAFDLSARERVLLRERVLTDFFGDKQVLEPFYLILVDVRLYLVPFRRLQREGGEAGTDEGLTGQRTLSGTVTATETDLGLDLTGLASDRPSAAVSGTAAPPQAAASSTPEPTQALGADAADGSTAQKAGGGCGSRRPRRGQASDQASAAAQRLGTAVPPQAAASSAPAQPTQALVAEGSAADVPAAKSEGGCCGARRSRGGPPGGDGFKRFLPRQPQRMTPLAADGGSTAQNGGGCCGSRRKGPASATAPGTALPPQRQALLPSRPQRLVLVQLTAAQMPRRLVAAAAPDALAEARHLTNPSAAAPNLAAPSQAAASSASAVPTAALGSDAADGGSTAQNGGGCCGSRRSRRGPASAAAPGTAPPPQAAASSAPAEKAGGCCGSRRSAAAAAAADPADAVGNGGKAARGRTGHPNRPDYLNYFRKSHPDSDWPYQQLKAAWRKQALKRTLECDADYLLLTTRRSSRAARRVRLPPAVRRPGGRPGARGWGLGGPSATSCWSSSSPSSATLSSRSCSGRRPDCLELLVITMETVAKEQRSFEALTEIERRQRGNQLRVLLHALQALNCSFEVRQGHWPKTSYSKPSTALKRRPCPASALACTRVRPPHPAAAELPLLSHSDTLTAGTPGRRRRARDGQEQVTTYRALLLERARTFYHLMAGMTGGADPSLCSCRPRRGAGEQAGLSRLRQGLLRHCAPHFDFYGRIRDGAPVAAMRPETAVQLFEALDALNRILLASPEAWESARACQELLVEVRHFLHRSRWPPGLRRDLPAAHRLPWPRDDLRRNLQLHLA